MVALLRSGVRQFHRDCLLGDLLVVPHRGLNVNRVLAVHHVFLLRYGQFVPKHGLEMEQFGAQTVALAVGECLMCFI